MWALMAWSLASFHASEHNTFCKFHREKHRKKTDDGFVGNRKQLKTSGSSMPRCSCIEAMYMWSRLQAYGQRLQVDMIYCMWYIYIYIYVLCVVSSQPRCCCQSSNSVFKTAYSGQFRCVFIWMCCTVDGPLNPNERAVMAVEHQLRICEMNASPYFHAICRQIRSNTLRPFRSPTESLV